MNRVLGLAAVCWAVFLPNGGTRGEEGARRPEISAETRSKSTDLSVGGPDSWKGVIASVLALRQIPRAKDTEVIADLRKRMDELPPAYMYELARRVCATDPKEASDLFNLAGMRLRYDAARCVDETAMAGVQATVYALQSPDFRTCLSGDDALVPSLERVRVTGQLFTSQASPWWICSHGLGAIRAGLAGKTLAKEDWLKSEDQWTAAREKVEDAIDYTIRKYGKR